MNWKLILGILLIFGAIKEFISIRLDFADGKIIDPIAAELGTLTLAAVGVYLIYKGRKKRVL